MLLFHPCATPTFVQNSIAQKQPLIALISISMSQPVLWDAFHSVARLVVLRAGLSHYATYAAA